MGRAFEYRKARKLKRWGNMIYETAGCAGKPGVQGYDGAGV